MALKSCPSREEKKKGNWKKLSCTGNCGRATRANSAIAHVRLTSISRA